MAPISNLGSKFRAIAAAYADQPALRYLGQEHFCYGELDKLSNQIARLLLEQGLTSGDVVAIFHDKSVPAFATMLACLKIGLTYTNLDPDSPWERLRKIILTCRPRAIVNGFADLPHAAFFEGQPVIILHLRDAAIESKLEEYSAAPMPNLLEVTGEHPAYIMFTSGSTGTPKGAVMSHANVLNFIHWVRERFQITPADCFSNVNPMFFDNSVFDFYAALFSGASLAPVTSSQVRDSRRLIGIINNTRCTVWFSVPSLLVYLLITRAFSATDFPWIRKMIFGGEGFPKSRLKQLYDLFGHRMELENVYGPTECTCICSAHTIEPSDFADMKALAPLGFLAPDFACEILASGGSADEGELFLRGPNVGLGYYNDPERTASAFIQNPTHRRFRDIGYCSGDLVRRDREGRLHFIGRTDFQIKHLGYRIELEEIEAAFASLPEVSECAVIYRKLGDGLGELAGLAVLARPVGPEELARGIAEIVPSYMVPRRITILELLPRNANGKIDRIALQSILSSPA